MDEEPAIFKRFALQEQERKIQREKKREESKLDVDPSESSDAFLSKFNLESSAIEANIDALTGAGGIDLQPCRKNIDDILVDILNLDAMISEASYFLPKYDLKLTRITVEDLRKRADSVKDKLTPKKRFAFSARKKPAAGGVKDSSKTPVETEASVAEATVPITPIRGLNGLEGKKMKVSGSALGSNEYSLVDLTACTVYLIGQFSALHIRKLRDCIVVAGPVTGSILIEDVSGCEFHLACRQVRIHSALNISVSLRVCSNPIIEHSQSVEFSPLQDQSNPSWAKMTDDAGLDKDSHMWSKVNDFGWLRTTPSPNWSLASENKYPVLPDLDDIL